MAKYQEVSHQVFAIFADYTPLIEGLSLDEAFLDVTASQELKGDAVSIARAIKSRIVATTQLTASVGVGPNKLVAKIASDLDKPDALTVITASEAAARLAPLPVRRLPGLGRKKGESVAAAGFATLGDLQRATDCMLWPLFGRDSARIRDRAGGLDDRPVVADRDEKSISAEETFDADIGSLAHLEAELLTLADRTSARLRDARLVAGCVNVKIRTADFRTRTRQQQLRPSTQDGQIVARAARDLLRAWLRQAGDVKLRLLGVGVSELAPAEQLQLFAAGAVPRPPPLDATLDAIRRRFGAGTVKRASALPDEEHKSRPR